MDGDCKPNHGVKGKDVSYWIASTPDTNYPPLKDSVTVDVAILGGGIAGITTALLLKKAGLNVAVVEGDRIVKDVTGNTTAHISSAQTFYYQGLVGRFGEEAARLCARSCQDSVEKIAGLVGEHGIDCDFSRNNEYVYAAQEGDVDRLKRDFDVDKRLGLPVSYVDKAPLPFDNYGAIRFSREAQFHPRKYLRALAKAIDGDGSYVFENSRATGVEDGEPCRVNTDKGKLSAKDVVVATNFPILNNGFLFARMTAYKSYVLGVRVEGWSTKDMFYSTDEPCHYIRSQPTSAGPLLIVGGGDHVVGKLVDTEQKYHDLEKYYRARFDIRSVDFSWSTQDNYTFDSLPFIGKLPEMKHVYVATGFKGNGMTYGTVAATVLSDLISRGSSKYEALYDPARVKIGKNDLDLIKRNMDVAMTFAEGRFMAPKPVSEFKPGEAGLTVIDSQKAAAYKDEAGEVHAVKPQCVHMGCYVEWNNAEKTWDCPCHGSRYDCDGKVIHAPASMGLEKIEVKK